MSAELETNYTPTQPILFRGASAKQIATEITSGGITGRERTLYLVDAQKIVDRYNVKNRSGDLIDLTKRFPDWSKLDDALIENFRIGEKNENQFGVDTGNKAVPIDALREAGLIREVISSHVTGGISRAIGTARRFSRPNVDLENPETYPVVVFLTTETIPVQLVKSTYDGKFRNQHPLLAGAVDSGSTMMSYSVDPGTPTICYSVGRDYNTETDDCVLWFKKPLGNYPQLDVEQEVLAYERTIPIKDSSTRVISILMDREVTRAHTAFTGEEKSTIETAAKTVWSELRDTLPSEIPVSIVVKDTKTRFGNGDTAIPRRSFVGAYDGDTWNDTYDDVLEIVAPVQNIQ